jgi:hypothetical protein
VDGGVSIYSIHLARCLAFSCFVFMFCKMSRISTGAGVSSGVGYSPLVFLDLVVVGSLRALVAVPRIKTNFYSSSFANCCSLFSLVFCSTLMDCVPFCCALINFINLSSYSLYFFSHLSSIAVMVSELTIICYGRWVG